MGNIFDINTLLKENVLSDELLVKPYSKETFMFSAIESLKKFNENSDLFTKDLYKGISEASSKEEENAVFGDFYNKYGHILNNYINEVNTMIGRFAISIDNLADANMKLANDQDILSCNKRMTCNIKKYKNLLAGKYPRFNALEIYNKEFDYIGQLMEDLGPIATDIAKLEVLATVHNSFCNKMKNKWIEKCIEDITGEDDCEDLTCYAQILNKLFVDEEKDIEINTGTIYAMKEEITGYEKYKDSAVNIGNKLVNDFTYMADNIGSLFYRNKDKVLKIRSNGAASRDYPLNTYGMNQLDIFMKSKVNQVSQMCSLYVIALSALMDAIISHITQCGDILEKVKDEIDDATSDGVETSDVTPDNEPENSGEIEGGEEPDEDEPSVYDDEEDYNQDLDFDNIPDNDEDESENEPEEIKEEEVPEVPEEPAEISSNEAYEDFERASAIYEYTMYAIDNAIQQESMLHYVRKEILREADDNSGNVTGYSTDDATFIEKIVITIQNLFARFTNLFQVKTSQRAEFVKKNANVVKECDFNIGNGFKCTQYSNIDKLGELKAQPLMYDTMKQYLTSEKDFMNQYYKNFATELNKGNNTSVKESIKLTIIPDKDRTMTINSSNIGSLIDFCINFGNQFNEIQKSVKDVKNASAMAKSISKNIQMNQNKQQNTQTQQNNNQQQNTNTQQTQQTSTQQNNQQQSTPQNASANMYRTHEDYLNEKVEVPKKPEGTPDAASADNPIKQVRLYFKVTTTVVSQRMTLSQTIFNDYFSIINGALKANGKPYYKGKKEPATNNNNQQNNQQQGNNNQQQQAPAK